MVIKYCDLCFNEIKAAVSTKIRVKGLQNYSKLVCLDCLGGKIGKILIDDPVELFKKRPNVFIFDGDPKNLTSN